MIELKPFKTMNDISLKADVQKISGTLNLQFILDDPKGLVEWKSLTQKPERKLELWKETCFEFFFSTPKSSKYWEVNISTEANWNLFSFDSYRTPGYPNLRQENLVKNIETEIKENKATIKIPIKDLKLEETPLEFSIAAVLKLKSGESTYWALSHLKEKPDFHVRESLTKKV